MWARAKSTVTVFDDADDLAALRARYNLTPGVLRLDGNSGGALPSTAPARLRRFVEHRWDSRCARSAVDDDPGGEAGLASAELAAIVGATPPGERTKSSSFIVRRRRLSECVTVGWVMPRISAAAVTEPESYTATKVRTRLRSVDAMTSL